MRFRMVAAVCLVAALSYFLIGDRLRKRLARAWHGRKASELVGAAQAAPMPVPAKTVFRLRCSPSELPSLSSGAAIRPETAPADLTGRVVLKGTGSAHLSGVGGCSFLKGGQQNADTAYLQFAGSGVGEMFDVSTPGAVTFTIESQVSFAQRVELARKGRVFRQVFDVYEEASRQLGLYVTPHDGFLAIVYSVGAGPNQYYFLPKGQEENAFGKGVAMNVKLAWDGRGRSQLFVNNRLADTGSYARSRPIWSAKASFSIGARDQHEFGGGYFSCADVIRDFTVASSGPYKDTVAPQVSFRSPTDGQSITGSTILQVAASDDDALARVRVLVDDSPVCPALSYPYRCFWDAGALPRGSHKIIAEASDLAGNTARKELAVTVGSPPADDHEPPMPVSSLSTIELQPRQIRVGWMPAPDNAGAAEYRVYRDGARIGSVTVERPQKEQLVVYGDSAVQPGRTYSYQVEAVDAAGNAAPLSAPLELTPPAAAGSVLRVGPGRQYAAPCAAILAARPGDTIEIDAAGNGAYDGDVCAWRTDNLTIRGVNGRPRIDSRGRNAGGKGVWVIAGRDNTVENIEISGATAADRNGAAIRLEAPGATLRHVYFHHNQDGVLATFEGGSLTIEFSEFAYNGDGSGQTHNLYINNADRLIFRYNYSHHAKIGHLLKSRARRNEILYNRLTDENGTASYEMDFPNGGLIYAVGNILQQSATTDNNIFVSCGKEGLRPNVEQALYFAGNTLVNEYPTGRFFDIAPMKVVAANNILAGANTAFELPRGAVNINNLVGDPGFVNAAVRDYRLKSAAPARQAAVDPRAVPAGGPSLSREFQYTDPVGAAQVKPGARPNIGAL